MDEYDSTGHKSNYDSNHTIDLSTDSTLDSEGNNLFEMMRSNKLTYNVVDKKTDDATKNNFYHHRQETGDELQERAKRLVRNTYSEGSEALEIFDGRRVDSFGYRFSDYKDIEYDDHVDFCDLYDWYIVHVWNCNKSDVQHYDCNHRIELGRSSDIYDEVIEDFMIDFRSQHPEASPADCEQFYECAKKSAIHGSKILRFCVSRYLSCISIGFTYVPGKGCELYKDCESLSSDRYSVRVWNTNYARYSPRLLEKKRKQYSEE